MIKAIIIDDEFHARTSLTKLITKYCSDINILGTGDNVVKAVELINKYDPDIVFLDIEMPQENGFSLFEKLPKVRFQTIFTTAYEDYAIKAFRVSALDYLTKPIDYRELVAAISRYRSSKLKEIDDSRMSLLLSNLTNRPDTFNKIVLPDSNGYELVNISDILYCRADGSYTEVYLLSGKVIIVSKLIKQLEELLPNTTFFRIHRSYLINLNLVKRFNKNDGNQVILESNVSLDVSERSKKEFISKLRNK